MRTRICLLLGALLLISTAAQAQVTPTNTPTANTNGVPTVPQVGIPLTPQQQQIMQLRSLQGRGGNRGVQRGAPMILNGYGAQGGVGQGPALSPAQQKAFADKAKKDAETAAKTEEKKARLRAINDAKKAAAAKK